ncbi:MAG TPA: amidohydrolase family protein [Streptosporangiaceae bacterium]|jgi:hypothetical protein|nr:amidohydrolase family protein [Streptosporangiaceae bacterium]
MIAGGARPGGGAGPAPDLRHHLAHLQFIRPDDLDRFRALGAVANFQPLWACNEPQMTELTLPVVGPERAAWQYRIGELARRGMRIAFGSDWPVSSADPLQEIHVAVNRRLSPELGTPGTAETVPPARLRGPARLPIPPSLRRLPSSLVPRSSVQAARRPCGSLMEQPFFPEEAVTVTEALTAFTAGVAYVNHRDTELGSLRPGSRADIAVLGRDILAIPPGEIGGTRVDLTIAGGQVVHGDELAVTRRHGRPGKGPAASAARGSRLPLPLAPVPFPAGRTVFAVCYPVAEPAGRVPCAAIVRFGVRILVPPGDAITC